MVQMPLSTQNKLKDEIRNWPALYTIVGANELSSIVVDFVKDNVEKGNWWCEIMGYNCVRIHFKNKEDLNLTKLMFDKFVYDAKNSI